MLGDVGFWVNRFDRARGHARTAIGAHYRIDVEHWRICITLDAVDGADVDAGPIFDADTEFRDDVGHAPTIARPTGLGSDRGRSPIATKCTVVKTMGRAERTLIEGVVRRCRAFASCSEAVLEGFTSRARFARVRKDRSVVEQGLSWPYLGVVAAGVLQAVLTGESGREHGLYDVLADGIFGEISFVDGGLTVVRYVAATDSAAIVLIPADIVRIECAANPTLITALSGVATKRTRTILDRFASHLALPATNRVGNLLLELDEEGRSGGTSRRLSELTQVQLARMAGTVREVVQRVLAGFQSDGILQLEKGRVIKLDRERLLRRLEGPE